MATSNDDDYSSPLPRLRHSHALDPAAHTDTVLTDSWRAGCGESRTSGSGRRPGETDLEQFRHRAPGRPHWLIGGPTALNNLVLLCPHHHARVEPATNPHSGQVIENPHRWEVRLNPDGLPEFLPPRSHDYTRTPRMHTRYTLAAYNR